MNDKSEPFQMKKRPSPKSIRRSKRTKLARAESWWSSGDDRWETASAGLAFYLVEKPRTWKELDQWANYFAVARYLIRHMLAWMELRKLVESTRVNENEWKWGIRDGQEWRDFCSRQKYSRETRHEWGLPSGSEALCERAPTGVFSDRRDQRWALATSPPARSS